jgi:hypothetical protein
MTDFRPFLVFDLCYLLHLKSIFHDFYDGITNDYGSIGSLENKRTGRISFPYPNNL